MKLALTIAGSDPTGGAGLQLDLKVFHSLGLFGLSLPTALTAQSADDVRAVSPVDPAFFAVQAETLLEGLRPHGVKTGMLATATIVEQVAALAEAGRFRNLVVDPVTVSSSGAPLLDEEGFVLLRDRLLPLARAVTPNIPEAARITGLTIEGEDDMRAAADAILGIGPALVVITGGHLEGGTVLNLLRTGRDEHWWRGEKVEGNYHGTGCAFSAAFAGNLALGSSPAEALDRASDRVEGAIRTALRFGSQSTALLDP